METYIVYYIYIYYNVFTRNLWNLSVHVFIKLILLGIIYFEGRACYIGKISLYMYRIPSSFVLYLIVKAVIVAGAGSSSLLFKKMQASCEAVRLLEYSLSVV